MKFEWDDHKERINIRKHGIDFDTASRVFLDRDRLDYFDYIHSEQEERYITIGQVNNLCIMLFVVYTERTDSIRIISARKAKKSEAEDYYDNKKRTYS